MNEMLLDYLLERLDETGRRQVESRLQVDAEARRHLEVLRQALAPLAADQELVPPKHLAVRTIGRVAEYVCRDLPRAPAPLRMESAARPWWRRADVLVAASLLLTFVGIGVPVLYRLRDPGSAAALVQCQDNLRRFHDGLKAYEVQHRQLPSIKQRDVAGTIIPVLQDAGALPASFNLSCPAQGGFQACTLTLPEIEAMTPQQLAEHAPKLLGSYAFTLGHRDENGVWHGIRRADDAPDSANLILADGPPRAITAGNSANHGGRGQNVLFLDGHVQFLPQRTYNGDDIFLNRDKFVAAGKDARDIVLGPSASQP